MRRKDSRTLQERAQDLEKVLTYCILLNIKKHYGNSENFFDTWSKLTRGQLDSDQQVKFCTRFSFKQKLIREVLGYTFVDGKKKQVNLCDVKPYFSKWFHYRRQFNKNYKSGKTFSVRSYWYIDINVVERWMKFPDVFNATSSFYSKLQYYLINILFLSNKGTIGGKTMTKQMKLRKEKYDKEYAEGRHLLTFEQMLKEEKKKKARARKTKLTIAKKAAKETLKDFVKLELENEHLKAEIERLKQLKDINSDIKELPFGKGPLNKKLYDDPDQIDWQNDVPEDFSKRDLWIENNCSEECKKKLREEFLNEANLRDQFGLTMFDKMKVELV